MRDKLNDLYLYMSITAIILNDQYNSMSIFDDYSLDGFNLNGEIIILKTKKESLRGVANNNNQRSNLYNSRGYIIGVKHKNDSDPILIGRYDKKLDIVKLYKTKKTIKKYKEIIDIIHKHLKDNDIKVTISECEKERYKYVIIDNHGDYVIRSS